MGGTACVHVRAVPNTCCCCCCCRVLLLWLAAGQVSRHAWDEPAGGGQVPDVAVPVDGGAGGGAAGGRVGVCVGVQPETWVAGLVWD